MLSRLRYALLQRFQNRINQLQKASEEWGDTEAIFTELYLEKIGKQLEAAGLASSGLEILDGGCGTGRVAIPLAKAGHHVTGIEVHKSSAESARKHAQEHDLRLDVIEADLLDELRRQPAGHYDAALCLGVLYTCATWQDMVQEMARVLKPGGLLFASFRTPFYFITTLLRQGQHEKALFVAQHTEGVLRLATMPSYYNWQTPSQVKALYEGSGLELVDLGAHGLYSGAGYDGMAAVADVESLAEPAARSSLLELERRQYEASAGAGRFMLAVGRRGQPGGG